MYSVLEKMINDLANFPTASHQTIHAHLRLTKKNIVRLRFEPKTRRCSCIQQLINIKRIQYQENFGHLQERW